MYSKKYCVHVNILYHWLSKGQLWNISVSYHIVISCVHLYKTSPTAYITLLCWLSTGLSGHQVYRPNHMGNQLQLLLRNHFKTTPSGNCILDQITKGQDICVLVCVNGHSEWANQLNMSCLYRNKQLFI